MPHSQWNTMTGITWNEQRERVSQGAPLLRLLCAGRVASRVSSRVASRASSRVASRVSSHVAGRVAMSRALVATLVATLFATGLSAHTVAAQNAPPDSAARPAVAARRDPLASDPTQLSGIAAQARSQQDQFERNHRSGLRFYNGGADAKCDVDFGGNLCYWNNNGDVPPPDERNDAKLERCPQPGCAGTVKRLLGPGAGLIFKGAGFYQTDYRSSSYQAGVKADGPPPKTETAPKTESAPKSDSGGGSSAAPSSGA